MLDFHGPRTLVKFSHSQYRAIRHRQDRCVGMSDEIDPGVLPVSLVASPTE
jgi:hypothetical protein